MKTLRTFATLALTASMALSITSCGNSSTAGDQPAEGSGNESVATINWINTKDDIAAPLNELVTSFNTAHPEIVVTVETLSTNSDEVIQSRDAAGQLPDIFPVFNLGEEGLGNWIDSGKIADVSQLKAFQALPDEVKEMVTTDDGKAYSIILSTTAFGVLYNKDLFAQAGITEVPRTISEMEEVCAKLKDAGITPFALGAKDGWTVSNQIWRPGLDYAFSKEWHDEFINGNASFKDHGYDIFPFLDLVLANCNEDPLDTDYMTQLAMMAEGEAAMACQGPWAYTNIVDMAPEMEDKFGFFPLTFGDTPEENPMWTMQEMAYVVSANADMEAIDTFLEYMVLGDGKEMFGQGLNVMNPYDIPYAGNSVWDDVEKYMAEGYVFDYQDNNRPGDFFTVDQTNLQDYIGGKLTQDQVLENMDAAWDEIQAKAQ